VSYSNSLFGKGGRWEKGIKDFSCLSPPPRILFCIRSLPIQGKREEWFRGVKGGEGRGKQFCSSIESLLNFFKKRLRPLLPKGVVPRRIRGKRGTGEGKRSWRAALGDAGSSLEARGGGVRNSRRGKRLSSGKGERTHGAREARGEGLRVPGSGATGTSIYRLSVKGRGGWEWERGAVAGRGKRLGARIGARNGLGIS